VFPISFSTQVPFKVWAAIKCILYLNLCGGEMEIVNRPYYNLPVICIHKVN